MNCLPYPTPAELENLEQRLQETLAAHPSTQKDYARDAVYSLVMQCFQKAAAWHSVSSGMSFEEYLNAALAKEAASILYLARLMADFTSDPVKAIQALREPDR